MQFIYQPLTWAFLLVLVPLLIHLINLMRQRRVKWAAMEFLLKSYKKHRRWIWLKQFFLLLLRMLVVAVIVAMLAGLVTKDHASFLGGAATHHFIILDDSLSMADRSNTGRVFDKAMQALRHIAEQLADQPTEQKVTLLRFSQATKSVGHTVMAADMNALTVDRDFPQTMERQKRLFEVSELSEGPKAALEMAERLMSNAVEQRRVSYILSDFRAKEWDQSAELKEAIRGLRKKVATVHLVRCVDAHHQNIAITQIDPEAGTLAAGVPLLVNIKVQNFGPSAAQQVQIRVSAKSYPSGVFVTSDDQVVQEQVTSLVIDEIPAGDTAARQAQLKFDRAGQHIVQANLTSDALTADNQRRCLIEIPEAVPVLLIDGSGQGKEGYYLESIFAPGRVVTGIQPMSRSISYLRDATDAEIERYAAIYLLNVERLDQKAISALQRYVSNGGGLAMFPGPNTDPASLMDLYADGEGLFPLPVQPPRDHLRNPGDETPDLQVNDHPIFRVLIDEGGKNRPLAHRIRIDRYFPVDPAWQPEATPDTEILATVRGIDPLVVSRRFGDGQVVTFLTTASPTWNNWAVGPSFPVVILQLHGFISNTRQSFQSGLTGQPIRFQLDTTEFRPEVEFIVPRSASAAEHKMTPASFKIQPSPRPTDSPLMSFWLGGNPATRSGETDQSGVYLAQLVTLDGQSKQNRFVLNVPTTESNLAILQSQQLAEQLDGLDVQIHSADELEYQGTQQDGYSWSQLLMGLLIAMLLGEQLLAYSGSYHPKGAGYR